MQNFLFPKARRWKSSFPDGFDEEGTYLTACHLGAPPRRCSRGPKNQHRRRPSKRLDGIDRAEEELLGDLQPQGLQGTSSTRSAVGNLDVATNLVRVLPSDSSSATSSPARAR